MPAFTRADLEQLGPVGIVSAVASWLGAFGSVLIVAAVLGRYLTGFLSSGAERPTRRRRRFHLPG